MANIRFFEFGNCYHYNPENKNEDNPVKAYSEEMHLGLWITGNRVERSWLHADEKSSFYELKAYVLNIFQRLGVSKGEMVAESGDNNIFGSSLVLRSRNGKTLAELGNVAGKLLHKADIDNDVYYADIHWENVLAAVMKKTVVYQEISKYPSVSRDLALLVDKSVKFEEIEQIACQSAKKILKSVELFDVYEGKNLPSGKKSYAVNFVLQDDSKTLADKQIDAIMSKLVANLKSKLGAELR